ncbi:30S ribosomal protein S19e [Methanobrevibacter curvatus]|uniref:Small ribosomal subunit protein eS19 n=1 Tax=Methanobrevibacter curvatus TaxID=49547 RepID=A0A162FNZ8_9EURY|nr:30S ribosomal protein S19e [Methanobrevibacter curvatus]KZX12920.1 30S ribosomal protein S19e [Methanobrevibacter curvatus]
MVTVYDVPADVLINIIANELNENNENISAPSWVNYVKTGVHKERKPDDINWWYTRCASILRRIYIDGPVGISRLRTFYGGKKDRGMTPEVFREGSGAIIRTALHQLESAGYVEKIVGGRVITSSGKSFLDKISSEVIKDIPELSKY